MLARPAVACCNGSMVRFGTVVLLAGVLSAGGVALAQGYSVIGGGGAQQPAGATSPTTTTSQPGAAPPSQQVPGAEVPSGTANVRPARGNGRGQIRVSNGEGRHPWEYGGVVPGNQVLPPGLTRADLQRARGRVVVAWPGFQMTPQGSRLFLAVTAQPQITVQRAPGRLIYRLDNAVVPVRNNTRPLVTSAFDSPVERAYLRQRGRSVEFVIELRNEVEPRLSQQADARGLDFVYVDFPAWHPPDHVPSVLSGGARPGTPATPVTDEERPPPVHPGN